MSRKKALEEARIIFSIIKDDIEKIKDFDPEELDFSDYFDSLKPIVGFFIDNRPLINEREIVKKLLLVYSIEIAKKPGSSFWGTFFAEINHDQAGRGFVFESVWECLTSLDCKPYRNSNGRQLVSTLFRLTDADPDLLNNMLGFFVYYYKNFKGQPIGSILSTYPPCQRYLDNKDRRESIIHSTEQLVEAIDNILIKYPNDLENEEFVKEILKTEYGIRGTWFSRKRITSIIKEVINTITPPQFSKILKRNRDSYVIHPELGTIAVRMLENHIIDYGKYTLHGEGYTVTPHFRISISDMKKWDFQKVGEDKGYSYYKKKTFFDASGRIVRKLCDNDTLFYIWCGSIPIGEEIEIDGINVKREGFLWNPKLKMMWGDDDNPPSLRIETGNIFYYSKKVSNQPFIIECGSQSKKMWLDSQGSIFAENSHFVLAGNEETVQITCTLDGNEEKCAIMHLNEHMLFSSSSRERIQNQNDALKIVKRRFGEHSYYLFSSLNPRDICNIEQNNIIIDSLDQKFGKYYLYYIRWDNPGRFRLKIGENIWIFESQRYIQIFLNKEGQFESINEMNAQLEANVQDSNDVITYRILNCNYEQIANPIDIDSREFINYKYDLKGSSILHEALENDLPPGEYYLEVQMGDLNAQKNFFILPHVDVKWPEILSEGEVSQVKITSREKSIRNPLDQTITDTLSLDIRGKVVVSGKGEKKVKPEEIAVKFSYVNPPIIKDLSPDKSIFVFGYRIYLKNIVGSWTHLTSLSELNFYDLQNSILLIFSHPYDTLDVFINEKKIMSTEIGLNGVLELDHLERFSEHCVSYKTSVKLLCHGFEKTLDIIWNPKIISIKAPDLIDTPKIVANLEFEGPAGSFIIIDLKKSDILLDTKKFDCHGLKEQIPLEFTLKSIDDSYFYYLVCNIRSTNGSLLSSTSVSITRNQHFYVQISILDGSNTTKNIDLNVFEKGIDQYIPKIVSFKKPIIFTTFAKSWNDRILADFLRKIIEAVIETSPKAIIIMGNNGRLNFPDKEMKIKIIHLHELIDVNTDLSEKLLDNALNPIKLQDLIEYGLGLSSKNLLDDFESYLPKANPIIFYDCHLIEPRLKEQITENYSDRTLIFLAKGE